MQSEDAGQQVFLPPGEPPRRVKLWAKTIRSVQTARLVFRQGIIGLAEYLTRSRFDYLEEYRGSVTADITIDFKKPIKWIQIFNNEQTHLLDLYVDFNNVQAANNAHAISVVLAETREFYIPLEKIKIGASDGSTSTAYRITVGW